MFWKMKVRERIEIKAQPLNIRFCIYIEFADFVSI